MRNDVRESLRHWIRLKWFAKKYGKIQFLSEEMHDKLGENAYGPCALCEQHSYFLPMKNRNQAIIRSCGKCPLAEAGYRCVIKPSPWRNVVQSVTIEEWLKNCQRMIEVLWEVRNCEIQSFSSLKEAAKERLGIGK